MASIPFGSNVRLLGRSHFVHQRLPPRLFSSPFSCSLDVPSRRGFASMRPQNSPGMPYNSPRFLRPNCTIPGLVFTRHFSKDSPSSGSEATTITTAPTPSSETVSEAAQTIPSESVTAAAPENASTITDAATSTLDAINTPLQYGDFSALGLAHWTPSGIVQWSMEIINTTTHIPWFWTIVAGTVFWRLTVLPFSINGLRNSSRLQPYQAEIQKVQKEMNIAVKKSDTAQRQRLALKLRGIYDKAGVSVTGGLVVPLVQVPVTLGMFFGIKSMCNLPVQQLKWSGMSLVPDLTIADPTWVLPLIITALVNIQIPIGSAEMDLKNRPAMGHVMNALRVLSVFAISVTATLPSGLLVSLITTSVFTILQSVVLQYRPVRKYLGMQDLPERTKLPSMKESVQFLINRFKQRVDEAKEMETRKIHRAKASAQMKRVEEARRR